MNAGVNWRNIPIALKMSEKGEQKRKAARTPVVRDKPDARLAHFPMLAFSFSVVCLCPGLFVSTWLLDARSEDSGIVSLAIVVNAIFWFGVFATIREIRRRSASRA